MKFSTRRRNKSITMTACVWSALLLVSAIAVFPARLHAEEQTHAADTTTLTARSAFERIHTSELEILPPSARLDMLDYWDVDSVYKASNAMSGLSWLENVTPDYLKVRISSVSTIEFKILNTKKEELLMTVYTVGDDEQAMDSQVKFYNSGLEELETNKYFSLPDVKDFFEIPKGSVTKVKELEQMIPFPTICVTAFPGNDDLQARLTVEKYINQDDWNIAKLFVKPYITFEWNKDKYKLKK